MIFRLISWIFHLPLQLLLLAIFALTDVAALLRRTLRFPRRVCTPTRAASTRARCSIVVLNWNGRHLLEESIPPLLHAVAIDGGRHQILVVDNGSDDDSVEWIRRQHPAIELLVLDSNYGFGEGNNRGMEAARHDIVVLLNNDMIVEEDFLAPLLAPFSEPDIFAVSSQILFPAGKRREETGNTHGALRHGKLELSHRPIEGLHLRRGALPVWWAGGGSSAFDREKFLALGGFSEIFSPCYVEDTDLSYRAWRRGWRVLLAAESRVLHKHRSSTAARFDEDRLDRMLAERKLWYLWKNFPLSRLAGHFILFPAHLGRTTRPATYWKSLRKLPRLLMSRFGEPRRAYKDPQVLQWVEHPLAYLDSFRPQRTELTRSPQRLRILIVSAYLPHLGFHGGAGRVFQLLRRVAEKHEVSLIAFVESDREASQVEQVVPLCRRVEILRRGPFEPVSFFPYEPFEEFNCPALRSKIEDVLEEEDFDIVHFEWTQMAYFADLFPHTVKVLTEIEVNYAAHRTRIGVEPSLLRKLRLYYNTLQTLYREVELCRRVDRVICVTDEDRDYMAGYLPEESLAVVNTGVDVQFYQRSGSDEIEPDSIVFVGAFRHEPNVDAMHFFCDKIFPDIRRRRPQARLSIVGSNPPRSVRRLGDRPGVEVTGFVEDIRGYYRRAQVVVVPLRTGVGIRGKVLEGWSAGKAMVATTLACQGIRSIHGQNILVADAAEEFANWTIALLDHPEFAAHLGRNGRETAETFYDWSALGREMCRFYESSLGELPEYRCGDDRPVRGRGPSAGESRA